MRRPGRVGRRWPDAQASAVAQAVFISATVTSTKSRVLQRDDSGVYTMVHEFDQSPWSASPTLLQGYSGGEIMNAVGYYGIRYDGVSWTDGNVGEQIGAGISSMTRLFADGSTWSVYGGRWQRWTGSAWVTGAAPTISSPLQTVPVCGVSATECWITSPGNDNLWHTTNGGTTWTNLLPQMAAQSAMNKPIGVYGVSANEVYFCGYTPGVGAFIVKWNGTSFSTVTGGLSGTPMVLIGTGPNDIWSIGWNIYGWDALRIYHWDGSNLSLAYSYAGFNTVRQAAITSDGKKIIFCTESAVAPSALNGLESVDGGVTWAAPGASWPAGTIVWGVGAVG